MQDVVADIFSELRLTSRLYFMTEFRGDFGVTIPDERRLVRFHYVKEGSCMVEVAEDEEYHLSEGELIIIPNGIAQTIKAHPISSSFSLEDVLKKNGISEGVLHYGSGDVTARLLCGYCQYDEELEHPILARMDTVVLSGQKNAGGSAEQKAALSLLSSEVDSLKAGMTGILSRLLEILFIQSFRESTQNQESSFVQALQDNRISKSLTIIHHQYAQDWTISSLANEVGMSRARFADTFSHLVGMPPIAYLTKWRLMKSRRLLENTSLSLEKVAERCGYLYLSTFSRRFKEAFNQTPSAYRKGKRQRVLQE